MMTELGRVTKEGIKVSVPSNPILANECMEDGMMKELQEEFQEFQVQLFNKESSCSF